MEAVEREPCPHCAEPVAPEARVCPHCRRTVLFDVELGGPVADGRQRYQAARALAALGAPFGALADLQGQLAGARPSLARGVTRAFAHRVQQAVGAHGISASLTPVRILEGGRRPAWVVPAAAVGAVAALTTVGLLALRDRGAVPAASGAPAATPSTTLRAATPLTTADIARRALPSTVLLRCQDSLGSGFLVSADTLLTNAHVLCPVSETLRVIFPDGRETTGDVLKSDQDLDLALVRLTGPGAAPLPLGDAGDLAVGDRVVLVGNPMGMEFTVHEGIVSSLSRSVLGTAYVQLDAKVNPGNSGGPVLDTQGRVVAVVSLKHPQAEGIGLALPINYAYAGQRDLIPGAPAAASPGFQAMLDRVESEERRQARDVAAALEQHKRLFLEGVHFDQYGRLVGRILQPASAPLGPQPVTFKLWNGEKETCTVKTLVPSWEVVPTRSLEPRVQTWLEKHGVGLKLYRGEAPMNVEQFCGRTAVRPGTVVELVGAHAEADKADI